MQRLTLLVLLGLAVFVATPAFAQPSPTVLTADKSAADTGLGGAYTTASVTLTANRLELLSVALTSCCTGDPAVTSTGATWVLHCQIDRRLFVYRTMVGSNQTGAVTITMPGGEQALNGGWSLVEWTGIDPSGTNGSGATGTCDSGTTSGTSLTVTMSGFSTASDRPYVTWKASTNGTQTVESGWTSLADLDETTGGVDLQHYSTWWRNDQSDTTPTYTFSASTTLRGLAIDVIAAAGGGGGPAGPIVSPANRGGFIGGKFF